LKPWRAAAEVVESEAARAKRLATNMVMKEASVVNRGI
jgi:hypothetical protein